MSDLPDELAGLDPDEVLDFLRTASDEDVLARVHGMGTGTVLGLLFDAWADRVRAADRAEGLLVFSLDDGDEVHRHGLAVVPAGARHVAAPPGPGRASVRTSLVRFLRVAAGAQDPKRLVLLGRMRLGGDVLWAVTTLAGLQR